MVYKSIMIGNGQIRMGELLASDIKLIITMIKLGTAFCNCKILTMCKVLTMFKYITSDDNGKIQDCYWQK